MAAGFGFSVGDLIAGLRIIYVSCGAVSNASSAQSDYTSLTAEVESLLAALEAIDNLDLEHRGTEKQWSALRAAVLSCKSCIDDFMTKIAKYEPHLQDGAKSGWTAGYRKIKWAICKREDVATFRAQLERHASSVNMLLITFQAKDGLPTRDNPPDQQSSSPSTALAIPTSNEDEMTRLLKGLTLEQRQCFQLLLSQNKQLQQSLDDIRSLLQVQTAIPPQVLLQQPVILLDAFGKTAPFHLEFIDSLDAFLAVLRIRSERAGVQHAGLRKIDNREFHIRDSKRRRDINVARPWSSVFRPGQNVDMSMVYRRSLTPSVCPQCGCENDNGDGFEDMECDACGLFYRKITEEKPRRVQSDIWSLHSSYGQYSLTQDEEESDFSGYRRIRIIPVPDTDHSITEQDRSDPKKHDDNYPRFFGMETPKRTPPRRVRPKKPLDIPPTSAGRTKVRPSAHANKSPATADSTSSSPSRPGPRVPRSSTSASTSTSPRTPMGTARVNKLDFVSAATATWDEIPTMDDSWGAGRAQMQWALIDSRSR